MQSLMADDSRRMTNRPFLLLLMPPLSTLNKKIVTADVTNLVTANQNKSTRKITTNSLVANFSYFLTYSRGFGHVILGNPIWARLGARRKLFLRLVWGSASLRWVVCWRCALGAKNVNNTKAEERFRLITMSEANAQRNDSRSHLFMVSWELELGEKLTETIAYGVPPASVSHAILLQGVHVYRWPPTSERPNWLLCTMGLSGHEMPVPSQDMAEEWARCEVACLVDPNWDGIDRLDSDETFAPMHMLRCICEHVVHSRLLIKPKDSLPVVATPRYSGAAVEAGPEYNCRVEDGRIFVNVYFLLPLEPELLQRKRKNGYDAVRDVLDKKYVFMM